MAGTGLRTAGGRPATQSAGEADGKGEGLRETGLGAAEVSVSRCQTGSAVGRWGDGCVGDVNGAAARSRQVRVTILCAAPKSVRAVL